MEKTAENILEIEGVKKHFGGIKAVNDVSFAVKYGEHLGVIGPNGAGKTTLFNLIAGTFPNDEGSIIFAGENIARKPARKRALAGISRTFQTSKLFLNLSVLENLFLALNKNQQTFKIFSSWEQDKAKIEDCYNMAKKLGLEDIFEVQVGELPHGKKRLLEIGQVLISGAKLIMLDEPAAGLPENERVKISQLVKELTEGLSLIMIDHDMDIIFDLADRVLVMDQGKILALGTPAEIRDNSEVQRIYVGGEQDDN